MSTFDAPEHFDANTPTWRARVRFVRDLAPSGMGVFMAPQRSMALRLSEHLYGRTPLVLIAVAIAWGITALALWPVVSVWGLILWSTLVAVTWGGLGAQWWRAQRPMLRPGASSSWRDVHVSNLWFLFLALASGILLIFPDTSPTHLQALCLILVSTGIVAGILSSTSVKALAAVLGPSIGMVSGVLILRGAHDLAASVALAGGLSVLCGLGLYHLAADKARRDVERA